MQLGNLGMGWLQVWQSPVTQMMSIGRFFNVAQVCSLWASCILSCCGALPLCSGRRAWILSTIRLTSYHLSKPRGKRRLLFSLPPYIKSQGRSLTGLACAMCPYLAKNCGWGMAYHAWPNMCIVWVFTYIIYVIYVYILCIYIYFNLLCSF